jgi:hypothetical protein
MMPVQQHARHHAKDARADARSSRPVPRSRPEALPTWESFPLADRQRLVNTLLQAARRQVEARSVSRRPTT